jgi:hypothetical protein
VKDDDPQYWCSCPPWVRQCDSDCPSLKRPKLALVKRTCPKCQWRSGDDWRQCNGVCPVPGSPHHDELVQYAFERLPLATQAEYGAEETRLRNIP